MTASPSSSRSSAAAAAASILAANTTRRLTRSLPLRRTRPNLVQSLPGTGSRSVRRPGVVDNAVVTTDYSGLFPSVTLAGRGRADDSIRSLPTLVQGLGAQSRSETLRYRSNHLAGCAASPASLLRVESPHRQDDNSSRATAAVEYIMMRQVHQPSASLLRPCSGIENETEDSASRKRNVGHSGGSPVLKGASISVTDSTQPINARLPNLAPTSTTSNPVNSNTNNAKEGRRNPTNAGKTGVDRATTSTNQNDTIRPKPYSSDLVVVLDMDECLLHSQFLSSSTPRGGIGATTALSYDNDEEEETEKYRQYEKGRSEYHKNKGRHDTTITDYDDEGTTPTLSTHYQKQQQEIKKIESFRVNLPDGDVVRVNKRPYLNEFLQGLASRYETHVFTAALEVYARPVLDVLDPMGKIIGQRFYRESCTIDEELGVYVKDLYRILGENHVVCSNEDLSGFIGSNSNNFGHDILRNGEGGADRNGEISSAREGGGESGGENDEGKLSPLRLFNERRIVLVDNNPLSFLANPSNGILVSNFYDDPNDETLPAVLELLEQLDGEDDVRPILDDMFGLKDALRDVTGGTAGSRRKAR